jgi:hypothetical protein
VTSKRSSITKVRASIQRYAKIITKPEDEAEGVIIVSCVNVDAESNSGLREDNYKTMRIKYFDNKNILTDFGCRIAERNR